MSLGLRKEGNQKKKHGSYKEPYGQSHMFFRQNDRKKHRPYTEPYGQAHMFFNKKYKNKGSLPNATKIQEFNALRKLYLQNII